VFYGFGHAEIGAHLLGRWGLPDDISEPVRQHHQTNWSQPLERLCAVVTWATSWLTPPMPASRNTIRFGAAFPRWECFS